MSDSDLQLTIGADASGVVQGVGEAKAALGDFAPRVDAMAKSFGGLASQLKDGLQRLNAFAAGMKADGPTSFAQVGPAASAAASDSIAALRKIAAAQKRAADEAARSWRSANQQILSAESQFVGDVLSGRKSLGQDVADIAVRTAQREIVADLQYFTERRLLQAEGITLDEAREKGGLLIHLLAERQKTAATASGAGERAAVENASFFGQIIAKLAALLGIHIGHEGAKTAATTIGATARAAAENTARATTTAAQKIAALAQVMTYSGVAGAAGVASFAGAPWPIDMGAPAFGAAMSAAAKGFGSLASAAGGFDIPAGVNPLTQLHAQEMVLPARLANPMRDMLAGFGSGGPPMAGGHSFSFGDTHIHGAPNMSPADFKQALAEHRASVAEAVAGALHGGWRPSYRQPVGAL